MYFPSGFGLSLSEIIAALRVGRRATAHEGIGYVAAYLSRLAQNATERGGADPQASQELALMVREVFSAQERGDWVRIADILQYELPHVGLERLHAPVEARLVVAPAGGQCAGSPVEVEALVRPNPEAYEYRFFVKSETEFLTQAPVDALPGRAYGTDPRWIWATPESPGRYWIGLHARRRGSSLNALLGEVSEYVLEEP